MLDIAAIRRDFPSLTKSIYLNTGGIGPISVSVCELLNREFWERCIDGSPLNLRPQSLQMEKDRARNAMARFIGTRPDEICFTRGVSDGANIITGGLPWQAGDELITTNEEHPAFLLPIYLLQRRQGVKVRMVEVANDAGVMLERLEGLLSPRTRLVILSHVTTDNGVRLPAKEICELSHRAGVPVYYDGAQAVGQFALDMEEIGCDFYGILCYKWMLGPYSAGVLYIASEWVHKLEVTLTGARAAKAMDRAAGTFELLDNAQRFEFGPRCWPLFLAMAEASRYLESLGLQNIEAHAAEQAAYLRQGLKRIPGVSIVSPETPGLCTGIVTFTLEGMTGPDISQHLRNQWNIITRPTGLRYDGVRVSVAFFTTHEELDILLEAVGCLARG